MINGLKYLRKRCRLYLAFSIFFCALFSGRVSGAVQPAPEGSALYAKAAVLMDGKTGRILYEKNAHEKMPMASTTKIMTCIIALENADPDTVVTASAYAASMPKVHLGMREGEQFYLKDLLYSLMLESHNDTAVAVAEGAGGDLESFLALMDQKAQELGCENTCFLTPNGLDREETDEAGNVRSHGTTAADLARIMCYCINESPKAAEFLKITRTPSYTFSDLSGKYSYSCQNQNALLTMREDALTGKTGFTNAAGYCYVGAVRRDDRDLVVALLACGWPNHRDQKWKDTKLLMQYGLDNYQTKPLPQPQEQLQFAVTDGVYDAGKEAGAVVSAKTEIPFRTALLSETDTVRYAYETETGIAAPVQKGAVLGRVKCYINDALFYEGSIRAESAVAKKSLGWALREVLSAVTD